MSDTSSSRGRVTITLGRSGQVVKRNLSASDASSPLPTSGTKRSVRDRIGSNPDSSLWHGDQLRHNKRQREDVTMENGLDGNLGVGKNDLRLKLLQKTASRQAESNGDKRQTDLREKLSKTVQPRLTSTSRQHLAEGREPRETRRMGRIPSARSSDDLTRMESMRSSYSSWTLDHIRRRSPEGFPSTSRGISPQRNAEDLQRRSLNRTYDGVRSSSYVTRDVLENSRPPSTASRSFVAHSTALPPVATKHVAPHLAQLPPSGSVTQRPSYTGDEPHTRQTVDGLLHSLGLGKYSILFKAEEVDMTALKQMRESDLKELGIPMGPRKKILLAVLPRAKRQS